MTAVKKLRALLRRLRDRFLWGDDDGETCVHGSDPRTCFDCTYWRPWQRRYDDDVYAPLPAAVLPGEDAWVERLNDIYTDAEAER